MKPGKALGPDGFSIEFFKTFGPKLIPLLLKVFEVVQVTKKLPPTMTQACISVLLKKNKDPLLCESYQQSVYFVGIIKFDYKKGVS